MVRVSPIAEDVPELVFGVIPDNRSRFQVHVAPLEPKLLANVKFTLPVTQEELAGMVGASRERVNKAIASFIKLKWLEQHDRTYHILDRTKLQQRAI